MIIKDWKKDVFTIPNVLSVIRLLLIPVYMTIYLNAKEEAHYTIAGTIMAVSCLTDMIDGMIARRFNMISALGKFLDPLADKLTQFTVIICLVIDYPVLWAIVGLFVIKEMFQLIAGIITFRKGRMLKGALISGKISTAVLFVSLIYMVMFPVSQNVAGIITIIDGILLLIAFADYFRTYYQNTAMIEDLPKDPES